MWNQIYNPLDNAVLSTIAAAIPVITLLVLIASGKINDLADERGKQHAPSAARAIFSLMLRVD